MNILITGANGFIGRRLSSRLISRGHQVTGLSQDISKPFFLNASFDIVIHLAAYNITHVGAQDEALYTAINVDGTKHLLHAVEAKRFIYLSTVKVYKNEGQPLTEDSPLDPQGAYAQSKLRAEETCRALLKKGSSLVILRSVNVMGWGQAPKAVLPVFFQKAKANQALDIIYSAHTPMQFVYVEDLIDAFESIIGSEDKNGIYNIAHEATVTLEQLARKIIDVTQSSAVLNIKNTPAALFSPVICAKAHRELGWTPKTGITGIVQLYDQDYAANT